MMWLAVALIVVVLLGAGLFWWQHRTLRALEARLANGRIDASHLDLLQRQISALQRDVQRLGGRVGESTGRVPQTTASEVISPYNQAIDLARHGLSASEVASQCGISRSEAELIVSLYRNSSAR